MAVVNPFQQIKAQLPPLAPASDPAPANLGFGSTPMPDDSGAAQMPPSKRPQVFGPTPQDRQETMLGGRLENDYQKDLHPWGTPDNHPGVWGKIGHALSVATGGPNRRLMEESGLEGRLNKLAELQAQTGEQHAQAGNLASETADRPAKDASEEGLQGAEAGHANAETDALKNPAPEYDVHDTAEGPLIVNKKTGMGQHLSVNGLPVGPKVQTKAVQLEIGGKPHQVLVNDADGTIIRDMGESGEKPPVLKVDNGAHEFAENERGRGLLDKAEGSYRTAQQGANGIRAAVDDASQGGKMSARMLPLEGALEITTANGVHRINRTEVDQYAGGGSLFDRIQGKVSGLATGVPFTPEIMQDMKHLADLQEKGAYENYKGAFDSATKRYKLSDEKPLNAPAGSGGASAPAGADNEVYVGGKLVGHTVGGKYVALAGK